MWILGFGGFWISRYQDLLGAVPRFEFESSSIRGWNLNSAFSHGERDLTHADGMCEEIWLLLFVISF